MGASASFAGLSLLTIAGCTLASSDSEGEIDNGTPSSINRTKQTKQAVSAAVMDACSFKYDAVTSLTTAPISFNGSKGFAGSSMAFADVTGDGKSDLLALTAIDTVTTYVGNGNGTFTKGPETKLPAAPAGKIFVGLGIVANGDFDNDGRADVVMVSTTAYSSSPGGSWFGRFVFVHGSASGAFESMVQTTDVMSSGGGTAFHIAHDFDGDGRDDFFYGNYGSQSVMFSNAGRTFSAASSAGSGNPGGVVALGAATGASSLFYLSGTTAQKITWNSSRVKSAQALQNPAVSGSVTGDLDGDGKLDIAGKYSGTASPAIRIGTVDTASTMTTLYGFKGYTQLLTTADVIGDGKKELVYADDDFVYAACGYTPGTNDLVASPLGIPLPYAVSLINAGDLNGDGKADFITTKNGSFLAAYVSQPKPAQAAPLVTLSTTVPTTPPIGTDAGVPPKDSGSTKPKTDSGTTSSSSSSGSTDEAAEGEDGNTTSSSSGDPPAPTTSTTNGCAQAPRNAPSPSSLAGVIAGIAVVMAAARRRRTRRGNDTPTQ